MFDTDYTALYTAIETLVAEMTQVSVNEGRTSDEYRAMLKRLTALDDAYKAESNRRHFLHNLLLRGK